MEKYERLYRSAIWQANDLFFCAALQRSSPLSSAPRTLYLVYLVNLRRKRSVTSQMIKEEKKIFRKNVSRQKASVIWVRFILLLMAVMALGVWMAVVGEKIAGSTGLSHTFVGGTLLAVVTSFPELVVTFAAMRAGSIEMALGNVFGSNLFDLSVLSFLDVFTRKPITSYFTSGQIGVTALAVLIPIILLFGMRTRFSARKRIGLDTALVFGTGVAGIIILYFS